MKKLVAIIFVVFVIGVLFYSRDFDWVDTNKKYVYETDNGLVMSSVDKGDFECCCFIIGNSEYSDFVDYFDVQIVEDYYIDGLRVINAYSKFFDKKIQLFDKKYNLQILLADEITIGYPQLYLGFWKSFEMLV